MYRAGLRYHEFLSESKLFGVCGHLLTRAKKAHTSCARFGCVVVAMHGGRGTAVRAPLYPPRGTPEHHCTLATTRTLHFGNAY